jgi:transcriptional repressor NrdR
MRCPFCGHIEDKVVDSRETREGDAIRRRRECLSCARRFTSYERVEEVPVVVVKKDGRRESFELQKLMKGLNLACQKRPVPFSRLEEVVKEIQTRLVERPDREIRSRDLGEMVMDELKGLDQVAYVRFASVYRDFKDLPDFVRALEALAKGAPGPPPRAAAPVLLSKAPIAELPLFPGEPVDSLPPKPRKKKT